MSRNADPIIVSSGAPSLRRTGGSALGVLSGLAILVAATGGGALWLIRSDAQPTDDVLVHTVERGEFVLEVAERGEIESADNVNIRCEVSSRGGRGGVKILELIPEGTRVEKGDFLIRLDSAELEQELIKQQIQINTKAAALTEAENKHETSLIALQEYREGTLEQERKTIQIASLKADENLARAKEYKEYSKKAYNKGVISKQQYDADVLAVLTAQREKEMAEMKSDVLEKFTSKKKIIDLKSAIDTSKAKLDAAKAGVNFETEKLVELKEQITKCIITAPAPGVIKYANQDRGGNSRNEDMIAEGREVHERQVLIQLPDSSQLQVRLKVNESVIDRIKLGMRAKIKVVGLRDVVLSGTVRTVSQYSDRARWYSGGVKEFTVEVAIDQPDERLRTGLSAYVTIESQRLTDELQMPVQALYAHGEDHFCIVNPNQPELRKIKPGITNDKFVLIEEGIEPGEVVSLNPRRFFDRVDLPELDEKQPRLDEDEPASDGEQAKSPENTRVPIAEQNAEKKIGEKTAAPIAKTVPPGKTAAAGAGPPAATGTGK